LDALEIEPKIENPIIKLRQSDRIKRSKELQNFTYIQLLRKMTNRRLEILDKINISMSEDMRSEFEDNLRYIPSITIRGLESHLEELKSSLLLCYFCGRVLTNDFINKSCHMNRSKVLPVDCVLYK